MSKVSEIFDSLVTRVSAVLPSYTHMPDAYSLKSNANIDLFKGFAVGIGPTVPAGTQEGFCDKYMFDTIYFVTVSNDYNIITNTDSRNADEKSITEDLYLVTKDLLKNFRLGGLTVDISFNDTSGPSYLNEDEKRFLISAASYRVRYQENLS